MAVYVPSIDRHFWCENDNEKQNIKAIPGTIVDVTSTGERFCANSKGEWKKLDIYEIPNIDL